VRPLRSHWFSFPTKVTLFDVSLPAALKTDPFAVKTSCEVIGTKFMNFGLLGQK
jgi:hypothetical protein